MNTATDNRKPESSAGFTPAHGSDLYSWEVSVKGTDWKRTVNARTSGQAKSDYHRDLSDPWPDIPYTAIRCRKIGAPHTSEQFVRNARYRGLPNVKCGQRVKVSDEYGVIVGHNSSANFDVLFDADSKYHGQTLNCHPDSCEMVNGQNDQAEQSARSRKEA